MLKLSQGKGELYMSTKKRILATILILAMALGAMAGTATANDTPSDWAREQVNAAIAANLVPQNLQSNYTQAITRAEFAALAVALYENQRSTIMGRIHFIDSMDVNVLKAAYIGVVLGVGNNRFAPHDALTREQAAVMLARLADALGDPLPRQPATFADNNAVSSWAIESVGQVQATGIMGGIGNNLFSPEGPYTREQSIVTIMRLYDILDIVEIPTDTVDTTPAGGIFTDNSGVVWRVLHIDDTGNRLLITEYVHGIDTQFHSAPLFVPLHRSDRLRPALNHWFNNTLSPELRARALPANNLNDDVRSHPGNVPNWYRENEAAGWTSAGSGTATASNSMFVLSLSEVNRYFPVDHASPVVAAPSLVAANTEGSLSAWWLRSPGGPFSQLDSHYQAHTTAISVTGTLQSRDVNPDPDTNIGFRPVLWVSGRLR
jgi:hypothetical protein